MSFYKEKSINETNLGSFVDESNELFFSALSESSMNHGTPDDSILLDLVSRSDNKDLYQDSLDVRDNFSNLSSDEIPQSSSYEQTRKPFFHHFNPFEFLEATSPLQQNGKSRDTEKPPSMKEKDLSSNSSSQHDKAFHERVDQGKNKSSTTKYQEFRTVADYREFSPGQSVNSLKPNSGDEVPSTKSSTSSEMHTQLLKDEQKKILTPAPGVPHDVYCIEPSLGRVFSFPASFVASPLLLEDCNKIASCDLPYSTFYANSQVIDKFSEYFAYVDQDPCHIRVLNANTDQSLILYTQSDVKNLHFGKNKHTKPHLLVMDALSNLYVWKILQKRSEISVSLLFTIRRANYGICDWIPNSSNMFSMIVKNSLYIVDISNIRSNNISPKVYAKDFNGLQAAKVDLPGPINSYTISSDRSVVAILVNSQIFFYSFPVSNLFSTNPSHRGNWAAIATMSLQLPSTANSISFLSSPTNNNDIIDKVICVSYANNTILGLFDFGLCAFTQEIEFSNEKEKSPIQQLLTFNNSNMIVAKRNQLLDIFIYSPSDLSNVGVLSNTAALISAVSKGKRFGDSGYINKVISNEVVDHSIVFVTLIGCDSSKLELILALSSGYFQFCIESDSKFDEGTSLEYPNSDKRILARASLTSGLKSNNTLRALSQDLKNCAKSKDDSTTQNLTESLGSVCYPSMPFFNQYVPQNPNEVRENISSVMKSRIHAKFESLHSQVELVVKNSYMKLLEQTISEAATDEISDLFKLIHSKPFLLEVGFLETGFLANDLENLTSTYRSSNRQLCDFSNRIGNINQKLEKLLMIERLETSDQSPTSSSNFEESESFAVSKKVLELVRISKNKEALICFTKDPSIEAFRSLQDVPDYSLDDCSSIHLLAFIHVLSKLIIKEEQLSFSRLQLLSRATSRLRTMTLSVFNNSGTLTPELFSSVVRIVLKNVREFVLIGNSSIQKSKHEFLITTLQALLREVDIFLNK
ncbi:hypothetical protein POMI540_0356 [Schizosaccharomyces pombe]